MSGGLNDDILSGGRDNDVLNGGAGADILTGGSGIDSFVFASTGDSNARSGIDRIADFTRGVDQIDLSGIDASIFGAGNSAFTFIGNAAFSTTRSGSATAGQLRVSYDAASDTTVIQGNTDFDTAAEFVLHLNGNINLTAFDFIL